MALKQSTKDVFAVIRRHIRRDGRPPTLREIADAMGWNSTNAVRYQLDILEAEGLISRTRSKPVTSRGIRIRESQGRAANGIRPQ